MNDRTSVQTSTARLVRQLLLIACAWGAMGVSTAQAGAVSSLLPTPPMAPAAGAGFGKAVAVHGDWMAVSAPDEMTGMGNKGVVYLYERSPSAPGTWVFWRRLESPQNATSFGISLSISDEHLAVGAPQHDSGKGRVYLFYRDADNNGVVDWDAPATRPFLSAPMGVGASAEFGFSVALDGDTLLVGSPGASGNGEAFLFGRNTSGADQWGTIQKLVSPNASASGRFGHAVGLSNGAAVIGAPDERGLRRGRAHIFEEGYQVAGTWDHSSTLAPFAGLSDDDFGWSISFHDDQLAIGAPAAGILLGSGEVRLYTFTRGSTGSAGVAAQIKRITESSILLNDRFGHAVAWGTIGGGEDVLLVGAPEHNSTGAVFEYVRSLGGTNNWGYAATLRDTSSASGDRLGESLAFHERNAFAGAPAGGRVEFHYFNKNPVNTTTSTMITKEDTDQGLTIVASDPDGDTLDLKLPTNATPNGGMVTSAGSIITYYPPMDFNGVDGFAYILDDGYGGRSTHTVSVSVSAVNDAPVVTLNTNTINASENGGPYSQPGFAMISPGPANESGQGIIDVKLEYESGDTDLFLTAPTLMGGTLGFVPDPTKNGSVVYKLTVKDDGGTPAGGEDTTTQNITINITPANDQPSAMQVASNFMFTEDDPAVTDLLVLEDVKPGDSADEATQIITPSIMVDNPALFSSGPVVQLSNSDATISFGLAPNAFGSTQAQLTLTDDQGASETFTFTITVNPVNDPPTLVVGADINTHEDFGAYTAPGWATMISPGPNEMDTVTTTISATNPGLFTTQPQLNPMTGTLTFTTAPEQNGTSDLTITLRDGGGLGLTTIYTAKINVASVNDAPRFDLAQPVVAVSQDSGLQNSGAPFALNVVAGPADESAQTVTLGTTNDNNALFDSPPAVDNSTKWLHFEPAQGMSGEATVTVYATDDGPTGGMNQNMSTRTFVIRVNAVGNRDPETQPETEQTNEDTPLLIDALANDTDPDGDTLGLRIVDTPFNPENGANEPVGMAVVQNGKIKFTPKPDYFGLAKFHYAVTDGRGGSTDSYVIIDVLPVQDAPVFVDPTPAEDAVLVATEGVELAFTMKATDADGDFVTYFIKEFNDPTVELQIPGMVVEERTGKVTWTPTWDQAGEYRMYLKAFDNPGETLRAITIKVEFRDEDADGLPDTWEKEYGLRPDSADSDGDNISDFEEVAADPLLGEEPRNSDGDDEIDALDRDSDNDTIPDLEEAGDADLETPAVDLDEDGKPDYIDEDSDDDGVDDIQDNCRPIPNPAQEDIDANGIGDICELDTDSDGVPDYFDNCPFTPNPRQEDSNEDGIGDACEEQDEDRDRDGVYDDDDNCPDDANPQQEDLDGDGEGDVCDDDVDGDQVKNDEDNCAQTPNPGQEDANENGIGDACDDFGPHPEADADFGGSQCSCRQVPAPAPRLPFAPWLLLGATVWGLRRSTRRSA